MDWPNSDIVAKAIDAAEGDWRVAAGMVAAGVLLGGFEWWRARRRARRERANQSGGDPAGCGGDCDRCAGGRDK